MHFTFISYINFKKLKNIDSIRKISDTYNKVLVDGLSSLIVNTEKIVLTFVK